MYLGVDVGGTKTLVAVMNNEGVIRERAKFPTPRKYDHWLLELRHSLAHFETQEFKAAGIGIPGVLDRRHGRGINFGNLPWKNIPIQLDLEHAAKCPVVLENDAKMAGLSESMLLKHAYERVLYLTVSTGIGIAFVNNQRIDTQFGDAGGAALLIEHNGKRVPWESFASGHAIVERYGKRASDITDQKTWQAIVRDLAKGMIALIAMTEPEIIVIGGGVGTYFDRYGKLLATELKRYEMPLVKLPVLRGAQRPEEAVVYGCYDLARQVFDHDKAAV